MAPRGRRFGRNIDGILLLDKAEGMSSNQALQRARRLLDARKAGHTGSLDPLATGMLPLCFGQATKVSSFLLDATKRYEVTLRLGSASDTGDREGRLTAREPVPDLDADALEAVLERFRGDIDQVPPMYSALKHQGQRLYRLARAGQVVERPPRRVSITLLRLLELQPPATSLDGPVPGAAGGGELADAPLHGGAVRLEVRCSKGTYIRSLAEDIAGALGTTGHVEQLRRTGVSAFDDAPMVSLAALEAMPEIERTAWLLPPDRALRHLPVIALHSDQIARLVHGEAIVADPQQCGTQPSGLTRVYAPDGRFLGLVDHEPGGRLQPRRLFAVGAAG